MLKLKLKVTLDKVMPLYVAWLKYRYILRKECFKLGQIIRKFVSVTLSSFSFDAMFCMCHSSLSLRWRLHAEKSRKKRVARKVVEGKKKKKSVSFGWNLGLRRKRLIFISEIQFLGWQDDNAFWLKCYKISSRHLNDKYIYCYHYLKVKHTNYDLWRGWP